jgi:hypothetical protein
MKDFRRSSYYEVIFLEYKSKMKGIESNHGQYENQKYQQNMEYLLT